MFNPRTPTHGARDFLRRVQGTRLSTWCRWSRPPSCVGIIIGVVTLTGVGTRLPATIIPLAEQSLLLALILIMVSSIVLGMGLPSAVVYLLLATLIEPVIGDLGVVPLAAHLFIFYFGMMSMVTPPVALAAYVTASIAGADIMQSGLAGFPFRPRRLHPAVHLRVPARVADVVGRWNYRPIVSIVYATVIAALGVIALAGGLAGFMFSTLSGVWRVLSFAAAALLLAPGQGFALAGVSVSPLDVAGVVLLVVVAATNRKSGA